MKGNLKGLLLAAAAGAMMMAGAAMAQAPAGAPPGAGPGAGGPRGGGFGGPVDRASTIQRFRLGEASLNLTAAQKAEIDKAADAYVTEMTAVNAKFPATQGAPPSADAQAARTKARENLTAAVNKVLDATQRTTWEAAQAAGRGQGGPGMGGPGGPGAGGPGGARAPGQ